MSSAQAETSQVYAERQKRDSLSRCAPQSFTQEITGKNVSRKNGALVKLGQLLQKLAAYGDDTPVIVRTIERDEIMLTVEVTRVKIENGNIVLVGDLDEINHELS